MNILRFLRFEARTIGIGIILLIALGYILFLPQPQYITHAHIGMIMLGVIVAAILLGFPIAFTLIGLGILFGLVAFARPGVPLLENPVFDNMVLRTYGVMTSDVIIAVPLFIFMGFIVERSGIIDRLFKSLELSMQRVPAALLALAYKRLSLARLKESVFLTARTTAMVCWLLVGSWVFSSTFAALGGQSVLENFVYSMDLSPAGFLFLTQLIIFLLGWPLDWTVIIIIFVPIFLPLLDDFGVDPIFFGILVALNTQTAFNTPPVAMAAFYLKGVAPSWVKLTDIFSGALPFVFMVFATMALVYVFPQLVLWLPDYLYSVR